MTRALSAGAIVAALVFLAAFSGCGAQDDGTDGTDVRRPFGSGSGTSIDDRVKLAFKFNLGMLIHSDTKITTEVTRKNVAAGESDSDTNVSIEKIRMTRKIDDIEEGFPTRMTVTIEEHTNLVYEDEDAAPAEIEGNYGGLRFTTMIGSYGDVLIEEDGQEIPQEVFDALSLEWNRPLRDKYILPRAPVRIYDKELETGDWPLRSNFILSLLPPFSGIVGGEAVARLESMEEKNGRRLAGVVAKYRPPGNEYEYKIALGDLEYDATMDFTGIFDINAGYWVSTEYIFNFERTESKVAPTTGEPILVAVTRILRVEETYTLE